MADAVLPIPDQGQAIDAAQPIHATAAVQPTLGASSANNALTSGPNKTDTVQLSETAQVITLRQQGLTVSEIAQELGIPQTEVTSDLGDAQVAQAAAAATNGTAGTTVAAAYSAVSGG